jgi:uncharacterized protein
LNIFHAHAVVTAQLRRRLWRLNTNGNCAQDDMEEASTNCKKIAQNNMDIQADERQSPYASLVQLMRTSSSRNHSGWVSLILVLAMLGSACTRRDAALEQLPDLSTVRANLAFTCVHEADHLPALDPQADSFFRYARYLQKRNGPKDFNDIARYYRIAAAYGHYRANQNLQLLISQGLADSPEGPKEVVDLAAQLIKEGVPGGYYDIGHYLEVGYGLKQDSEMSLRYMRTAADLGSPEAQDYIGDLLSPHDKAPEISRTMRRCAADQGYGSAANKLGINLKNNGLYMDAGKAFQQAVRAGDSQAASFLEDGFKGPPQSDRLNYMSFPNDPERSRRYKLVRDFLDRNDGRNPKVPDVDQIAPLPPATLPAWDGKFQWEKEQAAAVPPTKPPEELIEQLSKEKNLDPATGLALGKPEHTSQAEQRERPTSAALRLPVGTVACTGDPCPEDGIWRADLADGMVADVERSFEKGALLPALTVYQARAFASLDQWMGIRQQTIQVNWCLVGYIKES